MLSAYPACFIKEENGYSVIFPDLNNLATCGHTLEEALFMSVDCLAGYLYWLQKDGEIPPEPSCVDEISIDEIVGEARLSEDKVFVKIVTVDVAEYVKTHYVKDKNKL